MGESLHPVLTLRLFTDRKCFGPGVATLLHRVEEHHSLRAAALSMEMAYSKAWKIIKNCEEALDCKLLLSAAGGKNGGGAVLTEEGARFLAAYDAYAAAVRQQAEGLFTQHFSDYL